MKYIKSIFFLVWIFFSTVLLAQVSQEWVTSYNGTGTGYNFPKKSANDKFGNLIVAGNSDSTGGYDFIVLKYSPSGNLVWKQRYNGTGNGYDYLSGMVIDDSANVYVTGGSYEGLPAGDVNWVTLKYNSEGVLLWKRSLDWIANKVDEPFGINIDKEKNIYVIGYGRVTTTERAIITIKYNYLGDSIWTKSYTSLPNRSNWGYCVSIDDSLNVYSSGYGALPSGNEIVTIKYDSIGNEKWIKKFPTNSGDYLRPTFSGVDKESNIIVVGNSYFSSNYDFVTLKYSSNGDLLWNRFYNGGNIDRANSLFIDQHSNILIAGFTFINTEGDYLILKYGPSGDTLLLKNINGEDPGSTDEAYSIVSDNFGSIYVTGFSQSQTFHYDYLTLKLSQDGQELWSKVYRTAYDNYSYCLNLDNNCNVIVTGESFNANGSTSIVSVKYSQPTSIQHENLNQKDNIFLTNYPNPFNPITQINYNIPEDSFVTLKIFDITSKEIQTLANEHKHKGEYTVNFYGFGYPTGIYFYSIFIDGQLVRTQKMLLLK